MMGLIPTFAVFPVESIFAFNEIETGKAHSGTPIWGETGFPELSGAWNIKASKGTEKYSAEPENLKRALQLGARLRGGRMVEDLGCCMGILVNVHKLLGEGVCCRNWERQSSTREIGRAHV